MKTKKVVSNNSGMLRVACPRCKNNFGLDTKIVEKFGEVNYRYTCPYCSHQASLK